jgi:hypothetical protein
VLVDDTHLRGLGKIGANHLAVVLAMAAEVVEGV